MNRIKVLEDICARLVALKEGSTDKRFLAACDAYYVRFNKLLEDAHRDKIFNLLDFKIKDLVEKL